MLFFYDRLEIDNIELEKLGMHSLTTYNYNKTFVSLQKKIMEINAIFASIYSRSLPKYCTLNTRPSSAAVIPAETIKEEKSKTNKSNNAKLIMESKNVNNTSIQANNSSAKKESVKGSVKFSNEPPEVLQDSKKSQSETIGKISQKNSDKLSSSKGQESNGMVSSSKTLSNKADEDDDEEDEEDIDEDSEEESSGSDEDGSDTSGDESYESSEKENIRVENLKTDVKVSSEVNLLKFKTHESLVRSKIQLNHKLNNSVGRFQFVRLAQELCIAYKTEVGSDRIISNLLSETSRSKLEYELIWIFMKLSSLVPNENIDLWDLDMLLSKLNLKVPHFYEKIVRDQLDPEGKGGVTYNYLLHWLTVGNYLKYKKRWNFNWNEMFSSIESIDAYEIYLVRQRIMNRLLMVLFENMSKLPADTFDQTMHEEDRAVIKFSYLEYFHQLCAELKLEAENLFVDVERATSPVADMDPIEDQVNENMNNASAEKMPVPEDQLISTDKNFDKTDNSLLTDSRSVSEIANSELKSSIASTGIEGGKQLRISDTLKYAAMDSVDKEHFLHSWRKMSYLRSFEAILDTREVYKVIENKYESKFWRNRYKRVNRHCEHSEFLFLEASALMTKSLSTFCPIVESEATQNRRGIGVPEVVVDEEDSILQNSAALYANPELCYQERPSHELTFLMALDVYMHSFDTDCSGTFDENELKTLLKSLKLPADDRTILQTFPTFAYVTDDFDGCVHISINQLQSFLLDVFAQNPQQSYFKALNLSQYTKQWLAPRLTAVLRRQVARRQIQQTIRLSKEGQVVFGENYQREVGGYSLLLRSQMIAMRQVFLFRESVFCQLKIFTMAITLKNVWRTCANGIKGDKDTAERLHIIREQMLRYAYYIHCERGGLLITEMLHLVHFLVERMKFPQTQSLSSVTALLCNVKNGKELYWLSFDDAMAILGPYLDGCGYGMILTHPVDDLKDNVPVPFQFNFLNDADCRMLSIARQQALLISMNFQDIIVPETNYRCSVLGLMAVLQRSKGVVHWPVIRRLNAAFKSKGLDPGILPKEVVPVMMLSYGYSFADIIHPGLMEFVSLNHPDGKLASDLVRVIEVKARIASEITRVSTFGTRFQLKCRYPVSSLKYTVLYRKIAKAIQLKSDQINVYGGEYLKEIITGISQHPRWLN